MRITTANQFYDQKIERTLGVIWSESVKGVNFGRDMFAGLRNIWGGNVRGYEKELAAIKQEVTDLLVQKAISLRANAIIGVAYDLETIVIKDGVILAMTATGTAVVLSNGGE